MNLCVCDQKLLTQYWFSPPFRTLTRSPQEAIVFKVEARNEQFNNLGFAHKLHSITNVPTRYTPLIMCFWGALYMLRVSAPFPRDCKAMQGWIDLHQFIKSSRVVHTPTTSIPRPSCRGILFGDPQVMYGRVFQPEDPVMKLLVDIGTM